MLVIGVSVLLAITVALGKASRETAEQFVNTALFTL